MKKIARCTTLALIALCALAPLAVAPTAALAQGAENEYDLDLPNSGADSSTPAADPGTTSSDSDSGGFPVIVVVLAVAAGAAVGVALWRMRADRTDGADEPGDPPTSGRT
jgi:hypothetical protein